MDEDFVYKVYMGYWKSTREILASMPLHQCIGEPEKYLKSIRSSMSIPYIGKFYVPVKRYKAFIYNRKNNKEYEDKEDKASI